MHYSGFDLHKKTISICTKQKDGLLIEQCKIPATRQALLEWAGRQQKPWIGIMEATMFTGWVYDTLLPFAEKLKVAHPMLAKAITAGKHKNDKLDSGKLCDMGRCDWVPECYMMPAPQRHLRLLLRYRLKLLGETVRFKNTISSLLMSEGCEYDSRRLHRKAYFHELIKELTHLPAPTSQLLNLSRSMMELFNRTQNQLINQLSRDKRLAERVALLQSIDGVGPITALTWALEIGDPHRFASARRAMSYCGLTAEENSSGEKSQRGPISKQRNRFLQRALIEAAQLAPLHNAELKQLYERESKRCNHNEVTLLIARKLVAYLMAVDKSGKPFVPATAASNCNDNA